MAVPMLAGTFALNAYNLTDTWYVSRLGTNALAAMSFTFPVIMLLGFVSRGVATGTMSLVAHALGGKKQEVAARMTTHAIILITLISVVLSSIGMMTIKPLFTRLGASGEVLALTRGYMGIWYFGMIFLGIHMLLGDIIMGAGNTKMASLLMVSGTVLNFILDPIMIFGLLGFPKMGIRGAALATVLAEAAVMAAALFIVHRRHRLITRMSLTLRRITVSWRKILRLGIPSMLSWVLMPVSAAVIVRIVAGYGHEAVAACGVAGRIEMFAFMIPMTVGMSMVPFVAQNYGAKRFDRIAAARRGTLIFALAYGLFSAVVFFLVVRHLAGLFTKDPNVARILVKYICMTCFGYGFLEMHRYAGFCMTGLHRPMATAMLNAVRMVFLLIPLAIAGSWLFGLAGVFIGRLLSDIISGIIGVAWSAKVLRVRAHGPS